MTNYLYPEYALVTPIAECVFNIFHNAVVIPFHWLIGLFFFY